MGYASQYEDICERFFESVPPHLIYGHIDPAWAIADYAAANAIANTVKKFRARVEDHVLGKAVPLESLDRVRKLIAYNHESDYDAEKIDYWERAIAHNLRQIVAVTLSPAQRFHAGKFEHRLINGSPRQNHCRACKHNLMESNENFCIDCGGIKCGCGTCFCSVLSESLDARAELQG